MTIIELLNNVLAGGVLGVLGQGVRIAVGLKKLHDSNTAKVAQDSNPEPFNAGRLMVSLFVGFVAGAIGMLVKNPTAATGGDLSTEAIVTIIAVGYSGADFIEGLFNTYIQKFEPPVAAAAVVSSGGQTVVAATSGGGVTAAVVESPVATRVVPDRPLLITAFPSAEITDTSNSGEHDR